MNLEPGNLKDLPDFEPFPGYHGKMVHSDQMTVGHWKIDCGFSIPLHSHPHQQIVNVLDGEFELMVDGTAHHLRSGDFFVIPGHVPHAGRSLSDCYLIDVWHPPRDDYRT